MALRDRFDSGNAAFTKMNITNLVDVALTLVVILLMIAPFVEQGIDVRLPSSSPGRIRSESSVIVTVAPGPRCYLGGRKVSLPELGAALRQRKTANPDLSVIIKGDEKVAYRDIVAVLDTVKSCDITLVGLATRAGQLSPLREEEP